ncbi:MAG: DUF488 family protein [Phocaeicola sp.]
MKVVVDVRSKPYSRYKYEFNRERLKNVLSLAGIQYIYKGDELGGLNLQEESSRLPYLKGIEFLERGLEFGYTMAVMCCELDYKKCHRYSVIGRDMTLRGWTVYHINKEGKSITHEEASL